MCVHGQGTRLMTTITDAGDIRALHVPISELEGGLVLDHQVVTDARPIKYGEVAAENGYFVPSMDWKAIQQERFENAKAASELRGTPGWGGIAIALAVGLALGYILNLLDRKPKLSLLKD